MTVAGQGTDLDYRGEPILPDPSCHGQVVFGLAFDLAMRKG
jgi:hypothetical protein